MPRKPTRKLDPLLAALIDKLPDPGADWADTQQLSWLHLMALSMGNIYGGDVASLLSGVPRRADGPAVAQSPPVPVTSSPLQKPARLVVRERFVVDKRHHAYDTKANKRIMPDDIVTGLLIDERGVDGDMKTITWADGSTGVLGLPEHIAISAAV